ncbi:hypothetical protein AB2B38_001540 [Balneola sp. MJW-20]|uniref:hypothetical protein n=1 Tax=Gracilimonas aurantiaca TaxID=3234185 RepID=UPI003909B1FB
MRSLFISFAGFILFLFMEGFIRLVILFYHRTEFIFFGINELPGKVWIIFILTGTLINSWFSGMISLTIDQDNLKIQGMYFGLFILFWKCFEFIQTYRFEPNWYLFLSFIFAVLGTYISYICKKRSA